jgi:hypothetical protein
MVLEYPRHFNCTLVITYSDNRSNAVETLSGAENVRNKRSCSNSETEW